MNTPEFNSFDEAEETIKDQVVAICTQYADAIKSLLPVLKKAIIVYPNDANLFQTAYDEGNDHLHNLVQLKLELAELSDFNRGIIMELSSEVLANAIKYLHETPEQLSQTSLLSSDN